MLNFQNIYILKKIVPFFLEIFLKVSNDDLQFFFVSLEN